MATVTSRPPARRPRPQSQEELYPSSDGETLAETDLHIKVTRDALFVLEQWYAPDGDIYVAGDNFIYYQEGRSQKKVSPDCYVVYGAAKHLRDSYKAWEEGGRLPGVVIEITSRKTRREDTVSKKRLYEQLRVSEYFLFDPRAEYIRPRLIGCRLGASGYQPIEREDGALRSERLGLIPSSEGQLLRFRSAATGEKLLFAREEAAEKERERKRADMEAAAKEEERERADMEAQRARREGERADAEAAARKAEELRVEQAEMHAESAAARADAEAARRSLEEELARLRAVLDAERRRPA